MQTIRNNARERMKNSCKVCPICDGRACAGQVPGMGGLGNGEAFQRNVRALAEITLNMRLIHNVVNPVTNVSFLGLDFSMPVLAAPIGGIFNWEKATTEQEYAEAVIGGCGQAGIVGCAGDGVPPDILGGGVEAIRKAGGIGIPFVKPWEGQMLDDRLEMALSSGCAIMGMDIDAAGLVTLRKMGKPVGPKTPRELAAIIEKVHARKVKFMLKGIMTPLDARLAVDAGADAIVVSNHGGRVFQAAPATAGVLPEIAAAVAGAVPIVADGGVRNGFDVIKMLALGADMVGVGRPVTLAAIGGGSAGVAKYFETLRGELVQGMILTGCGMIWRINRSVLHAVS